MIHAVEARLESVRSGLVPVSDGWFVVNAQEAAWLTNDAFGARCVFEGGMPVLRGRPDLPAARFPQLGIALAVLQPGRPGGLYHAESLQEDFLVLAGECTLLVEGEERRLRPWDFVHCPPGTAHAFVGGGSGPCVVLMVGARSGACTISYPADPLARARGAAAAHETGSATEAYAPHPHWQPERPAAWATLPSV